MVPPSGVILCVFVVFLRRGQGFFLFNLRAFRVSRVYHSVPVASQGLPGGLSVSPSGGGVQTGGKHAGLGEKPGPVVEAGTAAERNETMYSGSIGTTQKRREFFDEASRFGLLNFFSPVFTLVSSRVSLFVFQCFNRSVGPETRPIFAWFKENSACVPRAAARAALYIRRKNRQNRKNVISSPCV